MNTTMQMLVAWRTQRGCKNLVASLYVMPEDKRIWKPMGTGRTVNDLLTECTLVNLKWPATLRNRVYTRVTSEVADPIRAVIGANERLTEYLYQSTTELIDVIQSVRDEKLNEIEATTR